MSDWKITGAITVGQAINVNSATQKAKIGTIVTAVDVASTDYGMGEFIYLKGSASTAVGSVVVYDSRLPMTLATLVWRWPLLLPVSLDGFRFRVLELLRALLALPPQSCVI